MKITKDKCGKKGRKKKGIKFYSSIVVLLLFTLFIADLAIPQINVFVSPEFVAKLQAVIDAPYDFSPGGSWDWSGATVTNLPTSTGGTYIDWDLNPTLPAPQHQTGRMHWSAADNTLEIGMLGSDVALQVGQEILLYAENNSGVAINNGKVAYVSGSTSTDPEITKADADDLTAYQTIGVATESIANGASGYVTTYGLVRGLNTDSWAAGAILYVSQTAGEITDTEPIAPAHSIRVGYNVVKDATNGVILVSTFQKYKADADSLMIGMAYDKPAITLVDDSGLKVDVENINTGDMEFNIDGKRLTLDCTTGAGAGGKARASLTAGADANNPITNYIYVDESAGAARLQTSTSLPTGAFAWIGKVVVPDATTFGTNGSYLFQRYTESVNDDRGPVSHEREKLRQMGALWYSGAAPTLDITVNGGAPDNVHLNTASGTVYQLHRQTWPAFTDGPYYYGNGSNVYEKLTDLNAALNLDDGTAITNNQRFNLVLWGAVNYSSGDCKLFVNLPNGTYLSDGNAKADVNNTADYSVPAEMRSVAFLIARLAFKYTTGSSGTWTELETYDLRGVPFSSRTGGATVTSSNEFDDALFTIYNNADATKSFDFDASGITTGTERTLTVQDADGTIAYTADQDTTDQNIVNLRSNAPESPYYWFDGVDDGIAVSDNDNLTFSDCSFLFEFEAKEYSSNMLFGKQNTAQYEYGVYIGTSGELIITFYGALDASIFVRFTTANGIVLVDETYVLAVTFDQSEEDCIVYLDGEPVSVTKSEAGSFSAMLNGTGQLVIGNRQKDNNLAHNGNIGKLKLFNKALTAAEVREYTYGAVDYKYKGASQTDLVTNSTFDSDVTGWGAINGTIAWDNTDIGGNTAHAELTRTSGNAYSRMSPRYSFSAVKSFKASIDYYCPSGQSITSIRFGILNQLDANLVNVDDLTTNTWTTLELYFTSDGTQTQLSPYIMILGASGSDYIYFDNAELTQIGEVAAYEGRGIDDGIWYDSGSNDLDGTVSGAIANSAIPFCYIDAINPGANEYLMNIGKTVSGVRTDLVTLDEDGDFFVKGSFLDSDGDAGTAGQFLSSTGAGATNWADESAGGGTDTLVVGSINKNSGVPSTKDIGNNTWTKIDMWSSTNTFINCSYDGTNKGIKVDYSGLYEITWDGSLRANGSGVNEYSFNIGTTGSRIDQGNVRIELDASNNLWRAASLTIQADIDADSTICLWGINVTDGDDITINGGGLAIKRLTWQH